MKTKQSKDKRKRHDDKMKKLGFFRRWVHSSILEDVKKIYIKIVKDDNS